MRIEQSKESRFKICAEAVVSVMAEPRGGLLQERSLWLDLPFGTLQDTGPIHHWVGLLLASSL
jgi:hypothetical protein